MQAFKINTFVFKTCDLYPGNVRLVISLILVDIPPDIRAKKLIKTLTAFKLAIFLCQNHFTQKNSNYIPILGLMNVQN